MIAAAFGRPARPQPPPDAVPSGEIRYVVEYDGEITGFGAARSYGEVGYIGPMAVAAAWRRQGHGKALLASLVVNLERIGCATILLDATDIAGPLYESYGFVDLDKTCVYERESGPYIPDEPDVDVHDLERALAIDGRIMGCDRTPAIQAFAREPCARLIVRDGGYALAHRRVLGPWLAEDRGSALRMFDLALAVRPTIEAIFIPESNVAAADIVTNGGGFRMTRTLRHMAYGAPSPIKRKLVYGHGSLGHG